jgi:hypothetical protein
VEKADARRQWLLRGGAPAEFERHWPAMKADRIRAEMAASEHAQQRQIRELWRG